MNTSSITTSSGDSWYMSAQRQMQENYYYYPPYNIKDTLGLYVRPPCDTKEPKEQKKKGDEPMENLYYVVVVSKKREILLDVKVVAKDEDEAKFEVGVHSILKEKGLKPKDVTILCGELGEVKVKREVQKVKLVEKDEE